MKKLTIRIDDDTHNLLGLVAEVRDVSVQQLVCDQLAEMVATAGKDEGFRDAARARIERQRAAFGL